MHKNRERVFELIKFSWDRNEFDQRFCITTAFLATHSGLTRWMDFQKPKNLTDSRPEYVLHFQDHFVIQFSDGKFTRVCFTESHP